MVDEKTSEQMTNDELNGVINEMLTRMTKVADLVDQAFPDKDAGPGIRVCADKLRSHVNVLTTRADEDHNMDDVLIDDIPTRQVNIDSIWNSVKELALKDCIATFKALEVIRNNSKDNMGDLQLRTIDVLGTHARELFDYLTRMQ